MIGPAEAAREALRWVAEAAVPAAGGACWPESREPGQALADDLYGGTAGVLIAFAEAKLSGIDDFQRQADAAAGRLRRLVEEGRAALVAAGDRDLPPEELSLYGGLAGHATALQIWADVTGDVAAADSARDVIQAVAQIAGQGRGLSRFTDLLPGEAGVLLALLHIGGDTAIPAAVTIADRLVTRAVWIDGEPDWHAHEEMAHLLPNFSHGAAGIAYALAAAASAADRPDLLEVPLAAGRRLARLGRRADGAITVPHSIPLRDPKAAISYGWCHGPTGTVRLFQQLDRLRPGQAWAECAEACRQAVRTSGLPARLYPGFWDNLGQCCGTAGVGEMALDRYQETGDPGWLEWAVVLARDVVDRAITDSAGARWSHTEYRATPPELPPSVGWMRGAAGIVSWLLRLTRVQADAAAYQIAWPDRPGLPCAYGHTAAR